MVGIGSLVVDESSTQLNARKLGVISKGGFGNEIEVAGANVNEKTAHANERTGDENLNESGCGVAVTTVQSV